MTLPPDNLQVFWLHDRLVDSGGRTIGCDGDSVKLEPRVMDVLLELARHPGQVVLRDEILERLWTPESASDEALSRCIYLLRKALGESADGVTFIETVPKSGYRLLVMPQDQPPGAADPASQPAIAARGGGWRLALPLLVLCIAISALIALRSDPASPTVYLLPIEGDASDPELQMIALGLTDAVHAAAGSQNNDQVDLLPVEARESQIQSRNQYAVHGVVKDNPHEPTVLLYLYIDSLRGTEVTTSPLNLFEIPRVKSAMDVEAFRDRREAVANRLMSYLTVDLPQIHGLSELQVEAFRLLMFADYELYTGKDCGLGAVSLLERSIELEPNFSRSWGQLGEAHWQQVWDCGRSRDHATHALAALEQARALDPTDFYGVYMHAIILTSQGRLEDAYAFLAPYLRAAPDQPYYLQAQAQVLNYAGFVGAADSVFDDMLESDPLGLSSDLLDLPMSTYYQGDYAGFLEQAPTRPMAQAYFFRALANVFRGDSERAHNIAARLRNLGSASLFRAYGEVLIAYLDGDLESARQHLVTLVNGRPVDALVTGAAHFTRAQLFALLGDAGNAMSELTAAVDAGFICMRCISEAPVLLEIASSPALEETLAAVQVRHYAFAERFGLSAEITGGAGADAGLPGARTARSAAAAMSPALELPSNPGHPDG